MRLLFVGVIPPHPGGAAVSLGQLLPRFVEAGCAVDAVAPITEQAEADGDWYAAQNPKLNILRFSAPTWQYAGKQDAPAGLLQRERTQVDELVARHVQHAKPDLIISGRESFGPHIVELAERYGIKSVLMVRGLPTSAILAGEYHAEQGTEMIKAFRRFDRVLCVAEFLTTGLRDRGVSQVRTMPNSIRLESFTTAIAEPALRSDLRLSSSDIVVLVPANFHWRKHPKDVVDSARIAVTREPRLRYVMVGVGALAQETKDYCRSLGLEDCFRFPGWMDYERMPSFFAMADIVVMASQFEGMSRAYLEAMAAGRPLIAADSLSAQELICDGENGLLYPVGDFEVLADCTVKMAHRPALRLRIGEHGRESVQTRPIGASARDYIFEFNRLLTST